jgi:IS6 family transposase
LSLFKRRRFPVEIILLHVRWYCKYGISYRDPAEMMQERGVNVDPSTLFRWVQRYAPEIEKRVRRYQGSRSGSWRATYGSGANGNTCSELPTNTAS